MTLIKDSKTTQFINKYLLNDVIYTVLILFMTFLTSVPYLQYHLNKYYKIILAYGVLVIIWSLVTGKLLPLIWNKKSNLLLVAFSVSYLITIFINRDSYAVENLKQLAYMVEFFIILYIMQQGKTRERLCKQIKTISLLIVIITFVLAGISYQMYQNDFSLYYTYGDHWSYLGYVDDTLWGFYNPNTCGSLCSISIILSLSMLWNALQTKSVYFRNFISKYAVSAFFIYNIILQYICLIHTGSRSSIYSLYIAILIIFILLLVKIFFKYRTSSRQLYLITSLPLSVSKSVGENSFDKLVSILQSIIGDLSGRDKIWLQGWNVFLSAPLFGVTNLKIEDRVIESNALTDSAKSFVDLDAGGLHNTYLNILDASGVVGFVLFFAFIVVIFLSFMRYTLASKPINPLSLMIFGFLCMILMSDFFESRIMFSVTLVAIVFWLFAGYMSTFMSELDGYGQTSA